MKESAVLDALTDEQFENVEKAVSKWMATEGPGVFGYTAAEEIDNIANAVFTGYKEGLREMFWKTVIPSFVFASAITAIGILVYNKIKRSKKNVTKKEMGS